LDEKSEKESELSNHTTRTVLSGAHAEYDVDELNRVRGQSDYFANGQMGRFDYSFDAMGRHRYEQRDWGTTDGYQYDPSDEVTGYQRDGNLNGDGTVSAVLGNNTTLAYDNNGNRAQVTGVGADTYTVNNLNQYTNDTNTGTMLYDPKGNLATAAGWTYGYDAQNRLTTMQGPGMTITMTYDPLNRVITRNVNGAVTQNVWEGWHLIEEHRPDWSLQRCYLQGANQNEMVAAFDGNVYSNHWYWQDGRGNTSHITGDSAALLERYTYDLSGAPTFYDGWDNERFGGSAYDPRFLFAGSQYLPETGLYDMRNRFYSPTLNRFLQTDPIGFAGDALNLYRYCGDDPVDHSDPMGLDVEIENYREGDDLKKWIHNVTPYGPATGTFAYAGHGSQMSEHLGQVMDPRYYRNQMGNGPTISAANVSKAIMNHHPAFETKSKIFLMVCSSGAPGSTLARDVAATTGRTGIAPDKMLFIGKNGTYYSAAPRLSSDGKHILGADVSPKGLGHLVEFSPDGTRNIIHSYTPPGGSGPTTYLDGCVPQSGTAGISHPDIQSTLPL
jgi:RHS repeat-associated protein